jgi:hypothetical protein
MIWLPTAMQVVPLGHATAESVAERARAGTDAGSKNQRLPFHRSTSGFVVLPIVYSPTATQFAALGHATLTKSLDVAPFGLRPAVTVHRLPSHRSTKGRVGSSLDAPFCDGLR